MAKKTSGAKKRDTLRILIVEARFYEHIADALLAGATRVLDEAGATYDRITVPGALEVPAAIAMARRCRAKKRAPYDGVVALGCVIQGETYHFEIVSNESARGLMDLSVNAAAADRQRHPHRRQRSAGARPRHGRQPQQGRRRGARGAGDGRAQAQPRGQIMAKSAPTSDKDARKANKRGAARLAAVQALYQMDIAGTGLNEILAEFESHWLGREVEGAQYLPAEAAFFRDIVVGRGARAAQARSADRRGAGEKLAAQAHRGGAARGACAPAPTNSTIAATCRRAWWCRNMPTSPPPSSSATRPAWSMPCSTSWRASCARPNSPGDVMAAQDDRSAEDRLIARYFAPLATHPGALGLTDDAAFIKPPPGCDLVLTTDAIIGGVHFFPDDRRAVGGRQGAAGESVRSRRQGRQAARLSVVAGAAERRRRRMARRISPKACAATPMLFGCPLFGGDTDRTPGPITISIAMFGSVPEGTMVRRAGAKAGDRVFVSGTIGDAALGLALAQEARPGNSATRSASI